MTDCPISSESDLGDILLLPVDGNVFDGPVRVRWWPWMPSAPLKVWPPIFSSSTVVCSVFFSSSENFRIITSLLPVKTWGRWHCSQVSRDGRKSCTGVGIGSSYL